MFVISDVVENPVGESVFSSEILNKMIIPYTSSNIVPSFSKVKEVTL